MKDVRMVTVVAVLLVSIGARAQLVNMPETRNAALRYWQAFSLMKYGPGSELRVMKNKTMNGEAAWDEARLGPLMDENTRAIEIMQQATLLPECDWGMEYSAGVTAPDEHRSKGMGLGELNLLYGIRALAKHDHAAAARAFVAGIRFAHHLGQDGTVLGILTASTFGLEREYLVIDKLLVNGQLDSQTKAEVDEALRSSPKDGGFDWAQAVRLDGFVVAQELKRQTEQMRTSTDPLATYQLLYQEKPPESASPASLLALLPSDSDVQQFHSFVDDLANACELPAGAARERLANLEARSKSLNPVLAVAIPNLARFCLDRDRLEQEREALLQELEKQ